MIATMLLFLAAGASAQVTGFDVYADGGVLHRLDGEKGGLFYRRSADGGKGWTVPVRVDAGLRPAYRFAAGDARVAASSGTVLAVWSAKGKGPMGAGGLVVAASSDGGRTWSGAASPSGSGDFGRRFPALAASGGVFTAAWLDRASNAKLMAARSEDGGRSWSEPALLDGDVCECCWNAATASGAGVSVLYRDRDPRELSVASTADGKTWSARKISPFGWRFNGCPHVGGGLASAGSKDYALVWTGQDGALGLHAVGPDGRPARLGGEGARHGDLAASGARLAAAWDEGGSVWSATSADGKAWSAPKRVSDGKAAASYPRVVASGAGFRAFWLEKDGEGPARLRAAAVP